LTANSKLHASQNKMGSSGPAEVRELVALVTGGASGIGRAVANKLASRGVSIVIGDLNEEQGTKVAAEIAKEFNVRSHFHQVNVTQEAEVKALVEAATALTGRLDYAANCAGICEAIWEEEESITTELFDR
jgi:3-hydroxyacyl-CoA dehydrogenase/3-hydroxy-2-methylbutyryl-CoA dehydrogenase